jgi:hypothetical protein
MSISRPILVATALAGTLDILAAVILTLVYGRPVDGMLRYVASGPFPPATQWGAGGAILGLAVHYVLMAIMAAVYVVTANATEALRRSPILWGVLYGIATYAVMNLLVVPLRFGTGFPPSLIGFATQFSFHILLVGIPIALVAARFLRRPAAPA